MGVFESIEEIVNAAGDSAAQMAETARVNAQNMEIKMQIDEACRKLGEAYYEGHADDPLPELAETVNEISGLYSRIKENERQLRLSKGEIPCPSCENWNLPGSLYCVKCGAKLFEDKEGVCNVCGTAAGEGSIFCTKCGNRLKSGQEDIPAGPASDLQYQPPADITGSEDALAGEGSGEDTSLTESAFSLEDLSELPDISRSEENACSQPEEKICPVCGMHLDPKYLFCTSCGSKLS